MNNRKIIYPNLILAIEGGIFSVVLYSFTAYTWYITIFRFSKGGIPCVTLAIIMFVFSVLWFSNFHNQIFCRMLITDKYIVWFGLFLPIVKLSYNEIKYIEIRTFDKGNAMYNNHTKNVDSFKFVLLSKSPIPKKRIDKIKSSRKKKLIKFAVNYKLCLALSKHIERQNPINYQLMLYRQSKK